jgi:hypothetical protein
MKLTARTPVLHPYYKLAYIKLAWGGKDEQKAEIAAGNKYAINWQDEARKLVEREVSIFLNSRVLILLSTSYRWKNIGRIDLRHHLQFGRQTLQVATLDQHQYCPITIDTALLFCPALWNAMDGRQSCAVI